LPLEVPLAFAYSVACFAGGKALRRAFSGDHAMFSFLLKSKIHLAKVTDANLEYEGSLTIDLDLMDIVKMLPYEKILVANVENGERFETYAIPGERGSGVVCLNGATAHKGKAGDRVIIFAFCMVPTEKAHGHHPLIVRVGEKNRPLSGFGDI
jgi:aspartate 1-decarboxylase